MKERAEPLTMKFRGERNYLQGADLHAALIESGGTRIPDGPSCVQFHSFLRHQPDVIWSSEPQPDYRSLPDYRGEAVYGPAGQRLYAVLLESDRPISERQYCNEKDVISDARVDVPSRSAALAFPCPGSPMEMAVFLNKQLHFQVLPHVKEKWLFVRLDLTRPLPLTGEDELVLQMKQVLADKFTKTAIIIDGQAYGSITFSTAA